MEEPGQYENLCILKILLETKPGNGNTSVVTSLYTEGKHLQYNYIGGTNFVAIVLYGGAEKNFGQCWGGGGAQAPVLDWTYQNLFYQPLDLKEMAGQGLD